MWFIPDECDTPVEAGATQTAGTPNTSETRSDDHDAIHESYPCL